MIALVTCSADSTSHTFVRRGHTLLGTDLRVSALETGLVMIFSGGIVLSLFELPEPGARYRGVLRRVCCITSACNGVVRKRSLGQFIGGNHLCTTMATSMYVMESRTDVIGGRSGIDLPPAANRCVKCSNGLARRSSEEGVGKLGRR